MRIKFLTLNILEGGKLFDEILSFLRCEDVDILTLQEASDCSSQDLPKNFRTVSLFKQLLNYPFLLFSPLFLSINERTKRNVGNLVLSKFPIVFGSMTFFDIPYGEFNTEGMTDFGNLPHGIQHVVIEIPGKRLHVFNVHGIWGLDGNDNARRLRMSEMICSKIKAKENVILAGDFNVRPDTQTIRNIEAYLRNVFKNELMTTFNMKKKENPGYATAVVDMIFVSRHIDVIDRYCPKVEISDHLPLVSVFEL